MSKTVSHGHQDQDASAEPGVMENQILIQKKAPHRWWDEWSFSWASRQTHAEEIEVEEHSASTNRVVYFDLCLIFLLLRFSLKK